MVETHPSGRLLYSAHAGTTHFFAPASADEQTAAFAGKYTGQTYTYYSDNNGASWEFVDRALPLDGGLPAQGFSDPEFAIDSDGNVFYSEINLANIATSASYDGGKTYALKNFFGAVMTDRQWMDGDRPNEYYFTANAFGGGTGTPFSPGTGHYIAKTTDGGATFTTNRTDNTGGSGLGDIRVDKRTGTLYEAHYGGGNLTVAAFRNARNGTLTATDTNLVAADVDMLGHWPAIDVDGSGNVYITWDESGRGTLPAGVYYSYSTNEAGTWATPVRVDTDDNTNTWPWLAVGDDGKVAIAYLEADVMLPDHDAQAQGTHGWRIVGAQTLNGLGCAGGVAPEFSTAVMTPDRMHTGTICQGGTTCQAQAIDRRLGDYFAIDIDGTGAMYAGYSDTAQGGAVALPAFARQSGGAGFRVDGQPEPVIPEAPLVALLPLAAAALGAAAIVVRRSRTA